MTLLETVGALLIAAIVLGGSAFMLKKAIESDKVTSAQQNLSTFRLDIKNLYKGEPDFAGLTTSIAVTNKVVPDGMLKSSGDVRNVWNGDVAVAAGTDPTTFTITHNNVPEYACVKMATFQAESWEAITVNGVEITQGSGMVAAISEQLAETNTIVFTSN